MEGTRLTLRSSTVSVRAYCDDIVLFLKHPQELGVVETRWEGLSGMTINMKKSGLLPCCPLSWAGANLGGEELEVVGSKGAPPL